MRRNLPPPWARVSDLPAAILVGWTADSLPVAAAILERFQWDSGLFSTMISAVGNLVFVSSLAAPPPPCLHCWSNWNRLVRCLDRVCWGCSFSSRGSGGVSWDVTERRDSGNLGRREMKWGRRRGVEMKLGYFWKIGCRLQYCSISSVWIPSIWWNKNSEGNKK